MHICLFLLILEVCYRSITIIIDINTELCNFTYITSVYKCIANYNLKGHKIGRKIGDMLEILTMGAVYQNKNLISRLSTEEKLEAYTTAGHKIEFCFFNTVNGQRQLFGAIECNTDKYKQEFWDVNETISELSYLTHSYFRYYGKFPSKIGKLIIEDLDRKKLITPENDFVLDNYAGSGTTLVEAKLKNYDSFGIDINPFAVLACKVKTRNYNMASLRSY